MGHKAGTVWDAVGNTPLIKITSLSEITGSDVYGKAKLSKQWQEEKKLVPRELAATLGGPGGDCTPAPVTR